MTTPIQYCCADIRTIEDERLMLAYSALSSSDRLRLIEINHPLRQKQFLAGRVLATAAALRAGYVVAPSDIAMHVSHQPCCSRYPSLAVSISHSNYYIAAACGTIHTIGIDSEKKNQKRPLVSLTHRLFGSDCAHCVEKLPVEQQVLIFYQWWTEREACYKARLSPNQPLFIDTWQDQDHVHCLVASERVPIIITRITGNDLLKHIAPTPS